MRKIEVTTAFKRDFKRETKGAHRSILNSTLPSIIEELAGDVSLAAKCRDHALTGNWKDYRDCHVRPDLVLVYRLMDGNGTEEAPARLNSGAAWLALRAEPVERKNKVVTNCGHLHS